MISELEMISFKKEDVLEILRILDVQTEKRGDKEIILNEVGQIATCESCKKELFTDNLGNVSHGSTHLFCDNPSCFLLHLVEKNY